MSIRIYLAGPDVFHPEAARVGREKQQMCREFGFEGLFPLDTDPAIAAGARAIFQANCALMERADAGVFNLTPFRGVSADAGTVFELGFMFATGKPVYGYSAVPLPYDRRAAAAFGPAVQHSGRLTDRDDLTIEDFGLLDNLMIVCALEAAGGLIAAPERSPSTAADALAARAAFRTCLERLAERFA